MRPLSYLIVGSWLWLPAAWSAVAGPVTSPRPVDLPGVWGSMSNDSLGGGSGQNDDDFRTNALTLQIGVAPKWYVVLDHAIMTNKAVADTQPARIDELTMTGNWLAWRQPWAWWTVGGGLRVRGDLGGESLQNTWHTWSELQPVDYIAYEEPDHAVVAIATTSAAYAYPLWEEISLPGVHSGAIVVEVNGQGVLASDGTWQIGADVQLAARGQDGALWIGGRYEDGQVGTNSDTLIAVQDHERGLWILYGMSVGPWFFSAGSNVEDKGTFGQLGFAHFRESPLVSSGATMQGDIIYAAGPAMGTEMMWHPASWPQPLGISLGLRFGNAGQEWADNVVEFRQVSIGPSWTDTVHSWTSVDLEGYAATQIGARQDRMVDRGDDTPFDEQDHVTGVGVARAGLRLAWGDAWGVDRTVRMGVGIGIAGWLPFQSATADNGTQQETYATPVVLPEYSLHVSARW